MARTFTKNLANYMSLGINALGPILNGATVISVHARVKFRSLSVSGGSDDRILNINIDGASTTGLDICTHFASPNTLLRIGARSLAGDTLQNQDGTTPLVPNVLYSAGGIVDFTGKTVKTFLNGVLEATLNPATFTNNAYTSGTPVTNGDTIGGQLTPPPSLFVQVDGDVSEVAIWTTTLATADFLNLSLGMSPNYIQPGSLVFYMPILGRELLEPALKSTVTGTITGSVPQAPHPFNFRPLNTIRNVSVGNGMSRSELAS